MAIRRCCLVLTIAIIFAMSIWPLGSVPEATADTLKFRFFNHITKTESFPVSDVEGHFIIPNIREGAIILENGELGWVKGILIFDSIKGAGTVDMYSTWTLQDGSIIARSKGTVEATPQGLPSTAKFSGDVIHGTGRFQGIKGTVAISVKLLPPEKGDLGPKSFGEVTLVYTLPSK